MGPITHRYGEVFWTELPETKFPDEIVKRFRGKGMAIVGYEVDQVRRKGDKDFDGSILTEDVSVPINVACRSSRYRSCVHTLVYPAYRRVLLTLHRHRQPPP